MTIYFAEDKQYLYFKIIAHRKDIYVRQASTTGEYIAFAFCHDRFAVELLPVKVKKLYINSIVKKRIKLLLDRRLYDEKIISDYMCLYEEFLHARKIAANIPKLFKISLPDEKPKQRPYQKRKPFWQK